MTIRGRLRKWLGINDDVSHTMLLMTKMDRRLTTRVDCMGLRAELIDPTLKSRIEAVEKRMTSIERRLDVLEAVSLGPDMTLGQAADEQAKIRSEERAEEKSKQIAAAYEEFRGHKFGTTAATMRVVS